MKVATHTDRLLRVRKTVLELLLAYGDHNCLMCEKNGECELQNLVYEHGIDTVRFKTGFVPRPVDVSSSMIVRDPNKCVLCGRCVRGCLHVQANGVIDIAGGAPTPISPPSTAFSSKTRTAPTAASALRPVPRGPLPANRRASEGGHGSSKRL